MEKTMKGHAKRESFVAKKRAVLKMPSNFNGTQVQIKLKSSIEDKNCSGKYFEC